MTRKKTSENVFDVNRMAMMEDQEVIDALREATNIDHVDEAALMARIRTMTGEAYTAASQLLSRKTSTRPARGVGVHF